MERDLALWIHQHRHFCLAEDPLYKRGLRKLFKRKENNPDGSLVIQGNEDVKWYVCGEMLKIFVHLGKFSPKNNLVWETKSNDLLCGLWQ